MDNKLILHGTILVVVGVIMFCGIHFNLAHTLWWRVVTFLIFVASIVYFLREPK